jgi:hypothetical protein
VDGARLGRSPAPLARYVTGASRSASGLPPALPTFEGHDQRHVDGQCPSRLAAFARYVDFAGPSWRDDLRTMGAACGADGDKDGNLLIVAPRGRGHEAPRMLHVYFRSLGGFGSLPGATVSLSRILPSRP